MSTQEQETKKEKKSKKSQKKKGSLRVKLTLIYMTLLAVTVIVLVAANVLFLDQAYLIRKENVLVETFEKIAEANENDELDDEDFVRQMEITSSKNDVSVIVLNSSYEELYSTGAGADMLIQQFQEVMFGDPENSVEIVSDEEAGYTIERVTDKRRKTGDYLVLRGSLDENNSVMLRIAMESLKESAAISMRFTVAAGIICLIAGTILIFFITKSITSPILKISEISKRMAALDFDAKYEKKGNGRENEIDLLGGHMNELSLALETSISELKTANNEMKLDIDRKEQIEMMRTDFLSNVSHELKTPIALIQGYAEGLQESVNDDAESRNFYCEVIIDEADKMNRMVRKLLTLNQLEFGSNEITMARFDICGLISQVVSSMSIMLQQDDISASFDCRGPVYVWADEYKVEEILTNYMSNAIHHIGGEKIIRIFLTRGADSVRISVFNTGTPIPEEDLPRLWEKFYKVDKSHSRQYGGSGIGLSIVKAIMDAFHQQCGVINHEDGVEFWFELDTKVQSDISDPGEIQES